MEKKTKIVRSCNKPILLEREFIEFIIDKITVLKEISTYEFQEIDQDNESRLDWAQTIINCDNILDYLKEKLI